ncbi:MAG TPA: DUF2927 domain-containing protein [Thermohalobaculum sp.]|nr:DUF2927 domain-containing protein [Thermohalobaculum sp.]
MAFTTAAMPSDADFGAAVPAEGTAVSNQTLAHLFTTLTHDMEWGDQRPHLVRYEGPILVGVEGAAGADGAYDEFLDRFLGLLRQNAGIDIRRSERGANLHIRFVGGAFGDLLPTVSCLVAPGDKSWQVFARNPGRHGGRALARAQATDHMTIFIPSTARPYLVRNCLLEEVTQALGPANDLYGLGASIFNDDAAHVWPTAFDYLMLRVLYSPEMRTGMDRAATEQAARRVLDRINPAGIHAAPGVLPEQRRMASWRRYIQRVFSRRTGPEEATRLAGKALELAIEKGPNSVYHCHSLLTLGRVVSYRDPASGLEVFERARAVCGAAHGARDVRLARIGIEQAAALLRLGRHAEVLPLADQSLPILAAHGQDERISSLYALRARALNALGRHADAHEARELARQWGAYAFGTGATHLAQAGEQ